MAKKPLGWSEVQALSEMIAEAREKVDGIETPGPGSLVGIPIRKVRVIRRAIRNLNEASALLFDASCELDEVAEDMFRCEGY